MIFKRRQEEIETAQAELAEAEQKLREVESRWPTVRSITAPLLKRGVENGFGEELLVAWTPRGRGKS